MCEEPTTSSYVLSEDADDHLPITWISVKGKPSLRASVAKPARGEWGVQPTSTPNSLWA